MRFLVGGAWTALDALGATFELECDSVRVRVSLPDSPEAFSARSRQRLNDHDVTTAANVLNSTATDLGYLDASHDQPWWTALVRASLGGRSSTSRSRADVRPRR